MKKSKEKEATEVSVTSAWVGQLLDLTAHFPPYKRQCGVVKKLHDPKKYGPVGSPLYVENTQVQALLNTVKPDVGSEDYQGQQMDRSLEISRIAMTFEAQSGVPASTWGPLIEQAIADA